MTIKEMKERKRELGLTYEQLSELSGVPLGTLQKVLTGATLSPRYETLLALEKVLGKDIYGVDGIIRESQPEYGVKKWQGEFTLEDYYEIPDDIRVELIDGVLYTMNSPTSVHQMIGGLIYTKLMNYVMQKKGRCLPMISPIDVQLDCDDKTMVQPDVLILCDRNKLVKKGGIYGAPDFIVEILTPSTKRKDMIKKNQKYMDAGVREYWLVDPDEKRVMVYLYNDPEVVHLYTFEDEIPVGIFDGNCKINFAEIYEYIEFMY